MDEQVVDTYFSSSGCSLHNLALQTLVQTCTDMQSCAGLYKSLQVCTKSVQVSVHVCTALQTSCTLGDSHRV